MLRKIFRWMKRGKKDVYIFEKVFRKKKEEGEGSTVSYGLDLVGGRSPEDLAEAYPLPLLPPGTLLSRQTGWSRRTQLPLLALGPCVRVHHVHEIKRFSRFAHALSLSLALALSSCIDRLSSEELPPLSRVGILFLRISLCCACACACYVQYRFFFGISISRDGFIRTNWRDVNPLKLQFLEFLESGRFTEFIRDISPSSIRLNSDWSRLPI